MIPCTTCGKLFESTSPNHRKCSKDCYVKRVYAKAKHLNFHYYMRSATRYFQNPLYQFFRLFHDEHLGFQMKQKKCDIEVYLKNW